MGYWNDYWWSWRQGMDNCSADITSAWAFHDLMDVNEISWNDTELNNNFTRIRNCLNRILLALDESLTLSGVHSDMNWIIKNLTLEWDEGFGEEVTWKSIMTAWWNAPMAGWGWTIQFIDFMRKAVWNEPMNIVEQESFL